jgi:uncharacterized membrane protein YvbJ
MFCSKCGEENPEGSKFCTKCGAALVQPKAPAAAAAPAPTPRAAATGERTSGMAVAALVMGILGFLFFGLLSILAIIFGGIGISQTNKDPSLKGRGMAVAGLVLGIIGIVGGIIWLIVMAVWSTSFWWWF